MMRAIGAMWCAVLCAALWACGGLDEYAETDETTSASPDPTPLSARDLGEGLVITELVVGSGPACGEGATVEVRFVAKLTDGTVWDSSERRKRTLDFDLSGPGLIEGLRRGIPGMRVGGRRRIEIPWVLGYGAPGRDPVPPKSDLVFEIELVAIKQPGGDAR